ncbi:MAG: hypothetical protein U0Q15_10815 [Kineosporiaceae bacterium]
MSGTTTLQDSPTRERATQAKDVAVERSGQVASTAKEQAAEVAGTAKEQAANLAGQVRETVRDQSVGQRDRLVGTLQSFAQDLHTMADNAQTSGPAADLVRRVAGQAHGFASSLENREPAELLDGVRDFARRRPGAFLLGAAVAGVIAGRATRGARAARSQDTSTTTASTGGAYQPAYGSPYMTTDESIGTPSTVGASANPNPQGWDAMEEEPSLGATNYGGPTGGDVAREVDLRQVTGESALAPVPENAPDDGYGEVLEPDGSGHRSSE